MPKRETRSVAAVPLATGRVPPSTTSVTAPRWNGSPGVIAIGSSPTARRAADAGIRLQGEAEPPR